MLGNPSDTREPLYKEKIDKLLDCAAQDKILDPYLIFSCITNFSRNIMMQELEETIEVFNNCEEKALCPPFQSTILRPKGNFLYVHDKQAETNKFYTSLSCRNQYTLKTILQYKNVYIYIYIIGIWDKEREGGENKKLVWKYIGKSSYISRPTTS